MAKTWILKVSIKDYFDMPIKYDSECQTEWITDHLCCIPV